MSGLLASDWVIIPAVSGLVFFIAYRWSDRLIELIHRRSLGQREEIMKLMDQMFMTVDSKKLTWAILITSFGLGSIVFLVLWPHLVLGLIVGSIVTVLGWSIPKLYVRSMFEGRCRKFTDQMVDGMVIMSNGIKAGLSVSQSMERVAENLPNPIAQEFGLVLSQMRLGRGMAEALNELGTRIPRPDVQMFVTSVNILSETGGNPGETFQTITTTIRERQKVEKKIEALTAQGLMQGIIITLVPFLLLLVFFLLDPNYIMPLFTTTFGIIAFLIMLTLQIIGGIAIRKIVKINV